MGFLDAFRRRPQLPIAFWLDDESRFAGVAAAVAEDLASGAHALVLAHFREALLSAGQSLARAGVVFETRRTWSAADTQALASTGSPRAYALLASTLPKAPPDAARATAKAGTPRVSIRAVDLHVLADENERIVAFLRGLPCAAVGEASTSFDDPVMQTLARPWLSTLLSHMGLKPGECIRSPLVNRQVHAALRKLERRRTGDARSDSSAEWWRRNMPT